MGWINFISMDNSKKTLQSLALFLLTLSVILGCNNTVKSIPSVLTGADVLLSEQYQIIKNKNVGIITNHTALLSNGVHLVDTLFARDDVNIKSLFGPEHGIRGEAPDGHSIMDGIDSKTGLPVYSLYGKTRKPTEEMLDGIDVLIFDIQDVGARFYTFISTMYYSIQTAAENNIPIIILDRPNPINGIDVQGPLLDLELQSFVGIAEIPIRHGMTVGELANLFNQPKVLNTDVEAKLQVVKLQNWSRSFYYNECNIKWVKPSPNMPILETAIVYPGLCLLEGTNISEGRGTYSPVLQFGSPYINADDVILELKSLGVDGCDLEAIEFTPVEIPNMSTYPKYKDQKCNGVKITLTDIHKFNPIEFGVDLIYVFNKLYPENFSFRENWIDKLWGSSNLRESIVKGQTPEDIISQYENELNSFMEYRKQFLLY
jgi:uncharacterized protein YbbC (DUF1343 family)